MGDERSTDKRGRITIPPELRERFGEDYRIVELHNGIKLVPVPEEPIAELQSSASDELRSATDDELRSAVGSTATAGDDER